ncbi:MAG: hypothetical protein NVS1B10_08800 [Candidatus Saccharimonadales bacterium]
MNFSVKIRRLNQCFLSAALDSTWKAVTLQISDVSNYLKGDKDVLQAYKEARAEESESALIITHHDAGDDNDLALGKK